MNERRTGFRVPMLGRRPFIAAALLLLAAWVAAAPSRAAATGKSPGSSPAAVVRRLYLTYDSRSRAGGDFFSKKTGKRELEAYFDTRLTDLLWRNILQVEQSGDAGHLDFDLLYDAQDTQITGFAVAPPKIERNQAIVPVRFKNFGQPFRITYRLRKTRQGWRIRNLEYGKGGNLIQILSAPP
jgi:hypothetical protein